MMHILNLAAMLMTLNGVIGNCDFPLREVFSDKALWMQTPTLKTSSYYVIGLDTNQQMSVEPWGQKKPKRLLTCVESYDNHRYLAKVELEGRNKTYFRCFQYTKLSGFVIRLAITKKKPFRDQLDCRTDAFTNDPDIMVAYNDLEGETIPCPLKGGYQMILHEGEAIRGHCQDSIQSYNPKIQFECGGSVNVIADFGRVCEPASLTHAQKMRVAFLRCVSTWQEGDVTSLLLQMRDMPDVRWCLQYKPKKGYGDDFLTMFLSVNGKCFQNPFADGGADGDAEGDTNMFGFLASYVPANDQRCTDREYESNCLKNRRSACFDTPECPSVCRRCLKKPEAISKCWFQNEAAGKWSAVNSRRNLTVEVGNNWFTSSIAGRFVCRDEAVRDLPGLVYPMVQEDSESTCSPNYACAQVETPAPGLLNFFFRPGSRDTETGAVDSCLRTHQRFGHIVLLKPDYLVTLVDRSKLRRTPCKFKAQKYRTLVKGCLVEVAECQESCDTLNITLNETTCGDHIKHGPAIQPEHVCVADLELVDSIRGRLVNSTSTGVLTCWIFTSARLFISSPEDCNAEGANRIFQDENAHITYDPLNWLSHAISRSQSADSGNCSKLSLSIAMLPLLLVLAHLCAF